MMVSVGLGYFVSHHSIFQGFSYLSGVGASWACWILENIIRAIKIGKFDAVLKNWTAILNGLKPYKKLAV